MTQSPFLKEGPKFAVDPRVEFERVIWSQSKPQEIHFDPLLLATIGLCAVKKNCAYLISYTELVKIRFKWTAGFSPKLYAEFVLKEEYGISRTIETMIPIPDGSKKEQVSAARKLGTVFDLSSRGAVLSRQHLLARRAQELGFLCDHLMAQKQL